MRDLSKDGTARALSGLEIVNRLNAMFLNDHVTTWENTIRSFDLPDYTTTVASTIISAIELAFGADLVNLLAR